MLPEAAASGILTLPDAIGLETGTIGWGFKSATLFAGTIDAPAEPQIYLEIQPELPVATTLFPRVHYRVTPPRPRINEYVRSKCLPAAHPRQSDSSRTRPPYRRVVRLRNHPGRFWPPYTSRGCPRVRFRLRTSVRRRLV